MIFDSTRTHIALYKKIYERKEVRKFDSKFSDEREQVLAHNKIRT